MPPRKRARKGQARGQAKQNQQQTAANEPCPQPGATGTPEIVRLCGDGGVQQSGNQVSYSPEINATGSSMLNTWTSALGVQGTPLAQTIAQNTQSDFQMQDVRCADDDIAMHVPQDICIKIWKNEYINLASLLKKNQKRRGEESGNLFINEHGQIQTRPKVLKEITNIREWTDAFLIFMTIYLKKYQDKVFELIQYLSTIREAESRCQNLAWREYDAEFRTRQALKQEPWNKIYSDLWLKLMTNTNKLETTTFQSKPSFLEAGRVAGPFQTVPFTDFRVSPLGLVPKKQPGEYRLIHHLSYPEGDSINDYIDPEFCSVQYTRFDQAVKMIQKLGKGALLGKADIKNAFRLMIISPDDFPLLGFMFDGQYFFDRCLPFGLSYSCALWEKFAHFLHYAVRESCTVGELEHYLDDFLFGGEAGTTDCQEIMTSFFKTCGKMGVPVADEKTEGPQTIIIFLGFELDSILMEVRIPKDKIMKLQSLIEEILHKSSITLEVMQSLLGSLNFMCRAIVPGRPFCRRLINATRGITKPYHHIRISKAMRLDLQTWLTFFKSFNGVSVFHDRFWLSNADLCLFTDSSASYGKGFGAYFQGKWTYGLWPAEWFHRGITDDITVLELFPIFVALEIWGQHLSNKKILFKCDNQAVVHILNSQTSKAEYVMVLVRIITLKCLQLNVVLKAEHLSTSRNAVTDSLSRLQMNRFQQLAPEAEPEPEPVPDHLWSVFNQEPTSL